MKKLIHTLVLILLVYGAGAQVFSPPVGIGTIVSPGVYNLTPASSCGSPYHAGAIWCTTNIDFNSAFVLTYKASFDQAVGVGADGMAVVFGQNITPTSINGTNAYLGYYEVPGTPNPDFNRSFGVEFDIFDNSFNPYLDDIAGNDHTAICPNAIPTTPSPGGAPVRISPSRANIKDGILHNYKITWCPTTTTFKVYFEDTLRMTSNFDFRTLFTTPSVIRWGFSGGTGASCSNQILQNIVLTQGVCDLLSAGCDSVAVADTLHLCLGDSARLSPAVFGADPILDILWSPITGLSSSTILNPVVTPVAPGYYSVTVRSINPYNFVVNGDFSAGNTGFTSSYTYAAGPSTTLIEGNYSVYNNPFSVHSGFTSFGDHTTGSGQMMIINGSPTPTDVWCQTISVTPNTDYDFSAWIANCSSVTVGPDVPILQFKINGILIGTPTSITSAPGTWTNFFSLWNSGVSTTATICIYDLNTTAAGNDFVLDDISFRQICTSKDSIYVSLNIPDTTHLSHDTTACITAAPLTLIAPPGYLSYSWNTGATTNFAIAGLTGTYWAYCTNNCATLIDTFHVTYMPVPVVNIGNDTAFCIGNTLTLSSVQPAGYSYLWSTGDTSNTITVSASGTFWLQVTNGYCSTTDTIHVTISPPPIVDLGPDLFNCTGTPFTLGSSIAYTSPTYLWSDGTGTPTITASTSGTYWLQVTVGGCPGADTIDVVVIYDTFTLSNVDTAICRGKYVDTRLTAYPTATFQWLPTAGIATPTARVPRIVADTSAMYYVTISLPGCPDLIDSFYIDVQPVPQVSITGTMYVCKFDTIHLHAAVTPNWYNHYTYHWSPPTFLDDTAASVAVFTGGDSTKLVLTVTTPIGCTGIDSALIVAYPRVMAGNDTAINLCPHDSVQLTPTPGLFYTWHPATYLSDSLSASPWVHAVNSIGYTAIAKDAHGCRDTINASVMIRPAGRIFLGDSVTIFPGEEYHIQPQTNCVSFAWFPHAGLNNASVSDPIAKPELSTKYIVHGWTEYGCEAVDSINIYYDISSLLALPNAFTPGSSINNAFKLLKRGDAELNYFRIYNRWGNMVFETKDINVGWDGNYKGKPQPFGVYVYQIEATTNTGKVFQKSGNVTLVR